MVAEIQQGVLGILNYIGTSWNFICGGLKGAGDFLGGMTMKLFGG